MINIPYELHPIWTDWLEEQEQETALLKFCLEYNILAFAGCFSVIFPPKDYFPYREKDIIGEIYEILMSIIYDDEGYGNFANFGQGDGLYYYN